VRPHPHPLYRTPVSIKVQVHQGPPWGASEFMDDIWNRGDPKAITAQAQGGRVGDGKLRD
jgi:hypothetical protein